MEEPTHNELLKRLKTILLDILGPDNLNVLGQFEFLDKTKVIGTSPAIRIGFPLASEQPIFRVKKDSGIQCTIDSIPFVHFQKQGAGCIRTHRNFGIYLDQYNPKLGLEDALEALIRMPRLYFLGDPIVSSVKIDPDKGFIPARAILYVQRITISRSYY